MQRNKKITILVTSLIVLFVFIVIAIIYEYVQLNLLTKDLEDKNNTVSFYNTQTQEIFNKIDEVQTNTYVEKWARSELNWTKENEKRIEY